MVTGSITTISARSTIASSPGARFTATEPSVAQAEGCSAELGMVSAGAAEAIASEDTGRADNLDRQMFSSLPVLSPTRSA
jgi:hypothetical protein